MIQKIDAADFCRMIDCAAAAIQAQEQMINSLNVFPVPDGDTGTNMSLTIATAAQELLRTGPSATLGKSAGQAATALLRGARGNSGVILSLLFRGISKTLKDHETADGFDFAQALTEGVSAAYNAIMKPTEGTILTVSRLAAKAAVDTAAENSAFEPVLEAAILAGQEALKETVNQNPVLKKAGVVDAGGMGFVVILEGMLAGLRGEQVDHSGEAAPAPANAQAVFQTEEITFAYDTVFIVRRSGEQPLELFRAFLESIGDSLVIGEDDESFKVHVHTNEPGRALTEAQKYGTLELAKIENMRLQHEAVAAGRQAISADDLEKDEPLPDKPMKPYGVVAVCAGDGLADLFRELGADAIVQGGQTMNPATQDILTAIQQVSAETVFVLPNNKNIILAAQQAVPLSRRNVVVIETRTVPEGITALLSFDPAVSAEENQAQMTEAAGTVTTMSVTYAARPSDFDGLSIHEGDYLALVGSSLFGTGRDVWMLLGSMGKRIAQTGLECITIYYGQDVSEEDAQRASQVISDACPDAEVTLLCGGQPVYYYLISAE